MISNDNNTKYNIDIIILKKKSIWPHIINGNINKPINNSNLKECSLVATWSPLSELIKLLKSFLNIFLLA